MLYIKEVNTDNPAPVYPPKDVLEEFSENADYSSLLSTLYVETSIRSFDDYGVAWRVGNSKICVHVRTTTETGKAAMKAFKEAGDMFASLIEKALPYTEKPYKDFYQKLLDDYKKNGIIMPIYGRL